MIGLRAVVMVWMRCWSAFGLGSGVVGFRWRVFSRPDLVVGYCHDPIVEGRKDFAVVEFQVLMLSC